MLDYRRLPQPPHIGIVREQFVEQARRVLESQNKEGRNRCSGARARRVHGQSRVLRHQSEQRTSDGCSLYRSCAIGGKDAKRDEEGNTDACGMRSWAIRWMEQSAGHHWVRL